MRLRIPQNGDLHQDITTVRCIIQCTDQAQEFADIVQIGLHVWHLEIGIKGSSLEFNDPIIYSKLRRKGQAAINEKHDPNAIERTTDSFPPVLQDKWGHLPPGGEPIFESAGDHGHTHEQLWLQTTLTMTHQYILFIHPHTYYQDITTLSQHPSSPSLHPIRTFFCAWPIELHNNMLIMSAPKACINLLLHSY